MAVRDYARLHWDWYADPVLRAIGELEPCALTLWPVLVAKAKKASHATHNPTGIIETTLGALAADVFADRKAVEKALKLMHEEGELLDLETGRIKGVIRIQLARFSAWNVPRFSKAEQEQIRRDRQGFCREKPDESGDGVGATPLSFTEREKEKEREKEGKALSSPAGNGPSEEQLRKVFDAWCQLFAKGATTKLDTKRKARIRWALKEYGREVVWQVLQGYASDPWRHEAASRNELRALLRDAASMERGLELFQQKQGVRRPSAAPQRSMDDVLARSGY